MNHHVMIDGKKIEVPREVEDVFKHLCQENAHFLRALHSLCDKIDELYGTEWNDPNYEVLIELENMREKIVSSLPDIKVEEH